VKAELNPPANGLRRIALIGGVLVLGVALYVSWAAGARTAIS